MLKGNSYGRLILALMAFFLIGHFIFLSAPFVNLESWYAGAAEMISKGKISESIQYLEKAIANPILSVVGVVPFYRLFGISEFSARFFCLITGVLALAIIYWAGLLFYSPKVAIWGAIIVAVNPLFWAYSGSVYADVPFVFLITLSLFCVIVALRENSLRFHVAAVLLLGLSMLTKYNAVAFIPVIGGMIILNAFYEQTDRKQTIMRVVKVLFLYLIIGSVVVIPYLLWVHRILGHLLHPKYVDIVGLKLASLSPYATMLRFFSHIIWVGVFTGPLFLFAVLDMVKHLGRKGTVKILIPTMIIAPAVTVMVLNAQASGVYDLGEMKLGWVEHIFHGFPLVIIASLCLIAGGIVAIDLVLWGLRSRRVNVYLTIWVLVAILIHSLFRPTNRYVLFVLPALAIYLADIVVHAIRDGSYKASKQLVVAGFILLFVSMSIFNSAYFASEGRAAARVANYLNMNQLKGVAFNPFNSVQCHSGYLIDKHLFVSGRAEKARYTLVTLKRNELMEDVVYEARVKLLGIVFKRYAVLKISSRAEVSG